MVVDLIIYRVRDRGLPLDPVMRLQNGGNYDSEWLFQRSRI